MRTLNLGILAHVDAGKTTLTERLLFAGGAIDHVGSVDAGTTRTDSLDLERERGITIRSAVASFQAGDLAVNIVDTPGHPDFIAEVERVLGVLDGAVLVVSAVEGIQPQTPLLFRALQRLQVPTILFGNKVDRTGADPDRLLAEMARRLAPSVVPMVGVRGPGRRDATIDTADPGGARRARLLETLAERDDAVLRAWAGEAPALDDDAVTRTLRAQVRSGAVYPVYFGSAATGVGVGELLDGLRTLLAGAPRDPDGKVSGRVFKIERAPGGERVAYVRLFAGTLRPRQRVRVGAGEDAKPTSIRVFAPDGAPRRDVLAAGEMAVVRGLGAVRVGDAIGEPPAGDEAVARFPRPALEAVVAARTAANQGSLHAALTQLAEQDPLINVRQDDHRHELAVSLYGEVQKEVIAATLERDYGIVATFHETTIVCIERVARAGDADEVIRAKTKTNITGRSSPDSTNPFMATLGIRIEPAPEGSGVEIRFDVEPRTVPLYLFRTHEAFEGQLSAFVRDALAEGPHGWQVTDCLVTVTECGYASPLTTFADYRNLVALVVAQALARAGTWVCEPLSALSLEMPLETAPGVLGMIGRLGGRVTGQFSANGLARATAVLPAGRVQALWQRLPGLSMGEGVMEVRPGGYQPVAPEEAPRRARSRPSPLERDAWLASLSARG